MGGRCWGSTVIMEVSSCRKAEECLWKEAGRVIRGFLFSVLRFQLR